MGLGSIWYQCVLDLVKKALFYLLKYAVKYKAVLTVGVTFVVQQLHVYLQKYFCFRKRRV